MNTLYWLVTITDRPTTDAFLKLYQSFGVNVSLRTVGAGTAIQETLSTLGLEKTEKAVLFCRHYGGQLAPHPESPAPSDAH